MLTFSNYLRVSLCATVLFYLCCSKSQTPASSGRIEEEEWFHGVLPREEVQRLLTEDGDYLVRESKSRKTNESQYVLSVYSNGHKHFIIQGSEVSYILNAFS